MLRACIVRQKRINSLHTLFFLAHLPHPMQSPQNKVTREIWLDCCRLIAIFTIVYGHQFEPLALTHNSPWTGLIMSSAFDASAPCTTVLMFFFLSGWLQKVRSKYLAWRQFIFLIIPLLIWNLIQIALTWQSGQFTIGKAITELGVWPSFHNANYPLWFLGELAWYSLFLPLIHRIPIALRGLFVLLLLWGGNLYWPTSWEIPRFANSFSFFVAGTMIHSLDITKIREIFLKYSWIPASLALGYILHPLFSPWTFKLPHMHISPLYSVVGCICLLSYGAVLERFARPLAQALASFAPAVFFIYAAHIPAFTLYHAIAAHYSLPELPPIYHPLYTIVFCIAAILVFNIAQKTNCKHLLAWVFLYKLKH